VKIYHDLTLSSSELHSNFGSVLDTAIPRLMHIIQRFIPTRPSSDPRFVPPPRTAAPLDWWDNLRFQFHGKFCWRMENVSFRWLLDTVPNYDWSILITTKQLQLQHSTGAFELKLSDLIVSVPNASYHLLQFEECRIASSNLKEALKDKLVSGKIKRHSLVLIPHIELHFGFKWRVNFPEKNDSTRHHITYIVDDDTRPQCMFPDDQFELFRSQGVHLQLDVSIRHNDQYSNWVALRADVLPWLTHKFPQAPKKESSDKPSEPLPDPLPKIYGMQINASVAELQVGAWLDERADSSEYDMLKDGICLAIPNARYSLDDLGRNKIDLIGIRAALLDIDFSSLKSSLVQKCQREFTATKWQGTYCPHDRKELNDLNSYQIFETLQNVSHRIKSLEYLLTVDQVNILDKSLDEILSSSRQTKNMQLNLSLSHSTDQSDNNQSKKEKAPWTVLVAEMKLLWTLDIRDRVLRIVKDILYAITFMKVNSRGTPQLLRDDDVLEISDSVSLDETSNYIEANLSTKAEDEASEMKVVSDACRSNLTENEMIETISEGHGTKVNIVHSNENQSDNKKPKSHLDYLLLEGSVKEATRRSTCSENEIRGEVTRKMTMTSEPSIESQDICFLSDSNFKRGAAEETIPTFDLQLSNPQIQLHSEKTGGGVIISMRGANIEGKMYSHLFGKQEYLDRDDLRVETLLRRTEFLYTLDRMELFSISNNIDLEAGLQWLGTESMASRVENVTKTADANVRNRGDSIEFQRVNVTNPLKDQSLATSRTASCNIHDDKILDKGAKSFPPELQHHERKLFVMPPLCQKIMDPCTFKTLQEFHRPPIDLTKEELADTIEKGLISSLTNVESNEKQSSRAIDHIEIFIDELSFLLDSHQFSTTLDVIRNVLLEPLPSDRERYNRRVKESANDNKVEKENKNGASGKEKSEASHKMEDSIKNKEWASEANQKSKKGREYLRSLANQLLTEYEEKQGGNSEPSIRRIEYTLCKAKWKIASPDTINDSEISFTGFRGVHDFTADGSVNTLITLEDIYVESKKPGSESMVFDDPTIILKTIVGVERSACRRCFCQFDRTANESNSCIFHPGIFKWHPDGNIASWTCCNAMWQEAPGCAARPHTGMERAVEVRMDALPRTVEGLTMYEHIEGNIYPGLPHTLMVQLTKSLIKSFANYFLGDGKKDESIILTREGTLSEDLLCPTPLKRTTSQDSSAEGYDYPQYNDGTSLSTISTSKSFKSTDSNDTKVRKNALFGRINGKKRKESATAKKLLKEQKTPIKKKAVQENNVTNTEVVENKSDASPNRDREEIVFVKHWRVGDINFNISVTGFGKVVNLDSQRIIVPCFHKAYKIGSSNHLIRKLAKHFITSLLSSGMVILRNKMAGKASRPIETRLLPSSDKGDESGDERQAEIMFASTQSSKKKKRIGRARLYTK